MKNLRNLLILAVIAVIAGAFGSCNKGQSYADLLNDENKAVNRFLADQRVVGSIPEDSVFECGKDAPYYQIDEEGNIFMQVISPGDLEDKPEEGDLVYFRFLCSNLSSYTDPESMVWMGNAANLDQVLAASFRFGNLDLESSRMWGSGLQMPLYFLGYNCEVNIIIKSQYGPTDNMTSVQPYIYNVRYYRQQT